MSFIYSFFARVMVGLASPPLERLTLQLYLLSAMPEVLNLVPSNFKILNSNSYTVLLAAAKSRTLKLLAFDEYWRFDTSALFRQIKQASTRARCMEKNYGNLRKPARRRRVQSMH
jgi:hypothetical protein